jgi:DNA-binding transcriptional LysR family regulator
MVRRIDWDAQIGRRLRLRDLHVFFAVVRSGSMAKAAGELRVTQPAVSSAISNLEAALRVRLLDRSPQGVEPTMYGRALLQCGSAVFDELRQGIRKIEFLADPTVGELRIGCVESLSATVLPPLLLRFSEQYPRVAVHVDDLTAPALDFSGLRERKYDCVLVRLITSPPGDQRVDDLNMAELFPDRLVVAAGAHSRWAGRRKIDNAELSGEPWILAPTGTWNYTCVADAFRARGLDPPTASLVSLSVMLRTRLLANGRYLTVFADSVMRLNAQRYSLITLPVELPVQPWPVVIVSLKNRTLSPVVERFIACAHDVAKSIAAKASDHPPRVERKSGKRRSAVSSGAKRT